MPTHPMLAIARTLGNPVVIGETVTFICQGKNPPLLIDDLHNWEENPQPLLRTGMELWSYSMTLPEDAYLEYTFLDPKTGEHLPDPFNSNLVWNGINANNHFFYMPGGEPTPLAIPIKGIHRGKVTKHQVPVKEYVAGTNRTVYLYQPPVNKPVPLLVVYDGVDYLKRAKLNVIVDNLIYAKRVSPFAIAMVDNGGQARSLEYSCSESAVEFVFDCVIPLAQEFLLLTPPGGEPYGVLGSSLGGLMSLFTGMRLPLVFGKVLSQSGAFILPEHEFLVVDLVRYAPRQDIDIWMDVGKFDWLLEGNQQMYSLLKEKKYKVQYHEFSGGHNQTSWCNDIGRGLEAMFR